MLTYPNEARLLASGTKGMGLFKVVKCAVQAVFGIGSLPNVLNLSLLQELLTPAEPSGSFACKEVASSEAEEER